MTRETPELNISPDSNNLIPEAGRYKETVQSVIDNQRSRGGGKLELDRSAIFRYPHDAQEVVSLVKEKLLSREKVSLLDIGVGNLEELSSYLAAIQVVASQNHRTIKDCVNVEIVELRSAEAVQPNFNLGKEGGAFLPDDQKKNAPAIKPPQEYTEAFVLDSEQGGYCFSQEIQGYLKDITNNPQIAHFFTSLEDYLGDSDGQSFDVVACNNVLQYLGGVGTFFLNPFTPPSFIKESPELYEEFFTVLKKITKLVVPGGLLIIHVDRKSGDRRGENAKQILELLPGFSAEFTEVAPAIYKRNINKT